MTTKLSYSRHNKEGSFRNTFFFINFDRNNKPTVLFVHRNCQSCLQKHFTSTTKFMVTHQSPDSIVICNMHLLVLAYWTLWKPSFIIWPRYLSELSILITVSFVITEVSSLILNFSGLKYKSSVFCSSNFSPNFSENSSHPLSDWFIPEAVDENDAKPSA